MRAVAAAARGRPLFTANAYSILARTSLMAVVLIGAMVPWYTLRLIPILTLGTAKVSLLDALAALATLLALPAIVRGLLTGPRYLLWVPAFVLYMAIPLVLGLRNHDAFLAIRESQAFPFYLLALAFSLGKYGVRDFVRFSGLYLLGTVIAMLVVFAHVLGMTRLPGYPIPLPPSAHLPSGLGVRYLEWTVPIAAFTIGVSGALAAPHRWTRYLWGAGAVIVAAYVLATHERFLQVLVAAITASCLAAPVFGGFRLRRALALGIAAALCVVFALGVTTHIAWLAYPVKSTLYRWSHLGVDDSISFRRRELAEGLPRFTAHPLSGEGLGGLVMQNDPEHPGHPWPYISSGYGFLLIKTGAAGLILYLGMVVSALWIALGRRGGPRGNCEGWPVPAIGAAGIFALLVLNLLDPSLDTPDGALAFSLFYGMLLVRRDAPDAIDLAARVGSAGRCVV